MAADITPRLNSLRSVIERYGDGGFVIAGQRHVGPVLVFADRVDSWSVAGEAQALRSEDFAPFVAADGRPRVDILLIGLGKEHRPLPRPLRDGLKALGLHAEAMATGPACRTFNVLVAEDRSVGAALFAV